MLAICAMTLMPMLQATGQWTTLTGQGINVKKSPAFAVQHTARGTGKAQDVELNGETLPHDHEFRQLGIGMRMHPKRGTGPLLTKRVQEAQTALKKSRSLPLGFDGRASLAIMMIIAAALYGVELADISKRTAAALESTVMYALWGPSRPCRSKEIVFALLVPGHRVAPTMVIPYRRMCWLARQARTRSTPQTIIQAIWEAVSTLKVTGPLGQALQEFRKLGWQLLMGWWKWTYPGAHAPINLALDSRSYVEHVFREVLRKPQLRQLEARRPRLFGGMDASIHRVLTLTHTAKCDNELDRALLRGVLAGALWTAVWAQARGLRATSTCPFCSIGMPEDKEHLLWWCSAWTRAKEPFIAEVMLLTKGLRLGSLRDWPPCLRLCGIVPNKAVRTSGMDQDNRWRKRYDDPYRIPRSWLFLPEEELEPKRKEL